MQFLVVKLTVPNSSYGLSKLALKTGSLQNKHPSYTYFIWHACTKEKIYI